MNFEEKNKERVEDYIDSAEERASSSERRSASHLWLISYSDFMTILLIFFLSMYGYTYLARASQAKLQKVITYSEFADVVSKMKENLGSDIEILDDFERITIKLQDKILFGSGENKLGGPARQTLAELANSLKLVNGDIIVQGHTDNVPIKRGHFKSNWELSAARSFSVIEELTQNGIEPQRLSAWGFGENRPIKSNQTKQGQLENRRIEIILLKKKGA